MGATVDSSSGWAKMAMITLPSTDSDALVDWSSEEWLGSEQEIVSIPRREVIITTERVCFIFLWMEFERGEPHKTQMESICSYVLQPCKSLFFKQSYKKNI